MRKLFGNRWLVATVITMFVLIAAATLWLWTPRYTAVFSTPVSAQVQTEVTTVLAKSNIPYDLQEGVLSVPQNYLPIVQKILADSGVANTPMIGYELFDQSEYGMSDFSQQIKYQRALEGELSRSIGAMDNIRHARVHLTPKKDALYQADRTPAKAAVIIHTQNNKAIPQSQALGIQNLVASAVEGLDVENILIISGHGTKIVGGDPATSHTTESIMTVEKELHEKAYVLLSNAFGIPKENISVTVLMNFDKVHSVLERPLLSSRGAIPLSSKESTNSLRNPQTDGSQQNQYSKDTAYAVGKEVIETHYAPANIQNISIAVVAPSSLSDFEIEKIKKLLVVGLGMMPNRGDQIEVGRFDRNIPISASPPTSKVVVEDHTTSSGQQNFFDSYFWYILIAFLLLSFVLFLLFSNRSSKYGNKASNVMTDTERQLLLNDLRTWMNK